MTTEHQVMTFLEHADPARSGDAVHPPMSARRYLETRVQQRSTAMSVLERTDETTGPSRPRWPMYAAAAAVSAIVIGAIAMLARGGDESVPLTTVEPPVTTADTLPPAEPIEGAQSAVSELFAAYNSGDTDAVLALLSDDVIMTERYGGRPSRDGEALDPDEVENRFAWNNAQGEQWTEPVCQLADEQRPGETTLECTWDTLDAVILAIDGTPIPTRALVVVANGAVAELHFGYSTPSFATLGSRFNDWMETHHPAEADAAGCCESDSREESVARGEARAEWAGRWATYRDIYGCAGTSVCTISADEWVAEYDALCTATDDPVMSADAADQLRALPLPLSRVGASETLLSADDGLLASGLDDRQVAALQQVRLDAMIELGVDEACHPDVG